MADTIHVPADQTTIQSAIGAAGSGDEIVVAPGTYFENLNLMGKSITLRSADGPDATLIDASNSGTAILCTSGESSATVIDGFSVTNASGNVGGGLSARQGSSPTIRNCIFERNRANAGGGSAASKTAIRRLYSVCFG